MNNGTHDHKRQCSMPIDKMTTERTPCASGTKKTDREREKDERKKIQNLCKFCNRIKTKINLCYLLNTS